jgi:hypothetical protein
MNAVSLEQFNNLPKEQQIAVHEKMKENLGVTGILGAWGISRSKYYYLLKKLNQYNQLNNAIEKPSSPAGKIKNISSAASKRKLTALSAETEKMSFSLSIQGPSKIVGKIMHSIEEMYNEPESSLLVSFTVQEL